eukprot:c17968_g1_i3.p1 GENE.c17968_g1_i3~~c17968_g1_i3.p1  ORF type:complete len:521 (+),score=201.86 c17968_g1_i3:911-2473(+)
MSKLSRKASQQQFAQQANTPVEHQSRLDIYSDPTRVRKTSIICTLGPKTQSVDMISALVDSGMNIARLNFSHGSHEYHGDTVKNIREAMKQEKFSKTTIAIALDTKGPEIRTGKMKNDVDVSLKEGQKLTLTTDPAYKDICDETIIYVDYENLPKVISVGKKIYVDDGLISLSVLSIDGQNILVEVLNSGVVGSRKGVNLPEVNVDLPALSEKDKKDLQFGVEQGVDMIFSSFTRSAADVLEVRRVLGEKGKQIKIISKIENHQGIQNFDEILAVTDGVMVARGDLGIEIPPEKVFLAQKMMIARCNMAGKPVICATQMLESMIVNPRPTRAEVSDVANAVLDGADCVMLSGETAKGSYPIEAVTIMSQICREAESATFYKQVKGDMMHLSANLTASEAVAIAIVTAANTHGCKAIVTLTESGTSARLIAKYRPACPIIVVARTNHTLRIVHLYRGCYPVFYNGERVEPREQDVDKRHDFGIERAKEMNLIFSGDLVILTSGWRSGPEHQSLTDFRITSA